MEEKLVPLLNKVAKDIAASSIAPFLSNIDIQPFVFELFKYIYPILFEIYQAYFENEKSKTTPLEEQLQASTNQALSFLYDFDVCPGIISRPNAYYLLHSII